MCARRQSRVGVVVGVVVALTRRSSSRFSSAVTSSTEIGRPIAPSRQQRVTQPRLYVKAFLRRDTSVGSLKLEA